MGQNSPARPWVRYRSRDCRDTSVLAQYWQFVESYLRKSVLLLVPLKFSFVFVVSFPLGPIMTDGGDPTAHGRIIQVIQRHQRNEITLQIKTTIEYYLCVVVVVVFPWVKKTQHRKRSLHDTPRVPNTPRPVRPPHHSAVSQSRTLRDHPTVFVQRRDSFENVLPTGVCDCVCDFDTLPYVVGTVVCLGTGGDRHRYWYRVWFICRVTNTR